MDLTIQRQRQIDEVLRISLNTDPEAKAAEVEYLPGFCPVQIFQRHSARSQPRLQVQIPGRRLIEPEIDTIPVADCPAAELDAA